MYPFFNVKSSVLTFLQCCFYYNNYQSASTWVFLSQSSFNNDKYRWYNNKTLDWVEPLHLHTKHPPTHFIWMCP